MNEIMDRKEKLWNAIHKYIIACGGISEKPRTSVDELMDAVDKVEKIAFGDTSTDKERLDFLQMLNDEGDYTRRAILRTSVTCRGWRLHESSLEGSVTDVREAIDKFMKGVIT